MGTLQGGKGIAVFDQLIFHVVDGIYITGVQAAYLPGVVNYLRDKCIKHIVNLYQNAVESDDLYWDDNIPFQELVLPSISWPDDFTLFESAISPLIPLTHEQLECCVNYVDEIVHSGNHILLISQQWNDVAAIFVLGYWLHRGYDLYDAIRTMRGAPRMSRKQWEMLLKTYPTPYTFDDVKVWIQSI